MNEICPPMPARPKWTLSGPKRASRVRSGHRGQLARLIRERPLFVNVGGSRIEVLRNGIFGANNPIRAVYDVAGCGSVPGRLDPDWSTMFVVEPTRTGSSA
jgi:hypothetical protein